MTQNQSRDEGNWAPPTDRLKVSDVPAGATNINVDGHHVQSPLQGFGQMVQKTFRTRLTGINMTPEQVMQVWKENFPKFQPPENHFFPSMQGIKPGSIILIDGKVPPFPGMPAIMPVAAGVMILYADDLSFTVMTPEGFPEAGWNTFSTFDEDGVVYAQVQPMVRASDPLYELFYRFFGSSQQQDKTWSHVLTSLSKHLGVKAQVEIQKAVIDPNVQWGKWTNIFKNAAFWTVVYLLLTPFRWIGNLFKRESPQK
jgi:hypothetical protein